jgi:SAM-dependent methyltransferase
VLNHLLRYDPVVRLVRELGGGSVLEVGSGTAGLARWLGSDFEVTAVDTNFDPKGAPDVHTAQRVVGDVLELPFRDNSFDIVVALDLLEHVAPVDRSRALAELVRTTQRRLIVGCPTGGRALDADRWLASVIARRGESFSGSWLDEHLKNGFPEARELRTALSPHGRVQTLRNENVWAHRLLMRAEISRRGRRITDGLEYRLASALEGGQVLGRVLVWLARGADLPPRYRTIAVLDVWGHSAR